VVGGQREGQTFNRATRRRITLRDAFDLALSTHWANAKAHRTFVSVANVVCAVLGDSLPLDEVDTRAVVKLKAGMKLRGVSAGTVNRKLAALQKLITLARNDWELDMDMPRIDKETEQRGRLRWLSDSEEVRLLSMVQGHPTYAEYAGLFAFLLDTGCRFSEAIRLPERDIMRDPLAIRLVGTKNGDERVVPLTQRAAALLADRPGEYPWGHLNLDQAERVWKWARVNMGLADDPEFVIHALRHTFASRLVQRGVRIEVVSKLLGHRTVQQTMVYAHLAAHNYQSAVAVLERDAPKRLL
jgi:integrase